MAHSLDVVRTYISKVFGKNTTPTLKQTQLIHMNTCVSFLVQVSNIVEHDVVDRCRSATFSVDVQHLSF